LEWNPLPNHSFFFSLNDKKNMRENGKLEERKKEGYRKKEYKC
jgi:hypothetical protein